MQEFEKLIRVGIDEIEEPKDQIRSVIVLEGLENLAESISRQGVIEPLIVIKKGEKYEIVAGHRRYLAAKMANMEELPCILRPIAEADRDMIKLHENSFRERINPIDEGVFFERLIGKYKLSVSELSRMCSRSGNYVGSRIKIIKGDERVKAALQGEQISMSQALVINDCENEQIRDNLLTVAIENGATTESLKLMRYDYEKILRNKEPLPSAEEIKGGDYIPPEKLIKCPICKNGFELTDILPVHICKGCYKGFIEEINKAE